MCFRFHKSCICSGQKEIPGCLSIATMKGQVRVALPFQTNEEKEEDTIGAQQKAWGGGDCCFSLAHALSLVSLYVTTSAS